MSRTRVKLILSTLIAALLIGGGTTVTQAEIDGDVRAGYYTDAEEPMIGGGILTSLGKRWYFNPNLEFVLVDNGDLFTVNGDFHYDFHPSNRWSWWLGAGPAVIFSDHDDNGLGFGNDDDDTDLGANLIIGLGQTDSKVRFFAQAKIIVADDSEGVIAAGIRF